MSTAQRKALYDSLAATTLAGGVATAWKNMEIDDLARAVAAGRIIQSLHPSSLLEVAAAYGFVTKQFRFFCPEVPITCLEIATPFCHRLRLQGYEVIEGDFLTVDLGDRRWDVVTCMQVLEHLPDWTTLKAAIERLARWATRYVFIEIPEGGPIDGQRHVLRLLAEPVGRLMELTGLRLLVTQEVPPQGGQIANGYTAMVQLLGAKGDNVSVGGTA